MNFQGTNFKISEIEGQAYAAHRGVQSPMCINLLLSQYEKSLI